MIRGKSDPNAISNPTGNIKNIRTLWPINDQDFYFSLMKGMGFSNMKLHQKMISFKGGRTTENCSGGNGF